MNIFKTKKKLIIVIILIIISLFIFFKVTEIVRYGYDRQSKTVELIKSIIPKNYIRKIRDNLFIIPKLKARNEFLSLQVKKYEQGYEGLKYKTDLYELKDQKFKINYFFTPFKRLDVNLGWKAEKNSLRAHYAEIKDDKIFLISGEGETIFFEKKNFLKEKLNFIQLNNNIQEIIKKNNLELIGIRDLHFHKNQILISMIVRDFKGITINIYGADLNIQNLIFKEVFKTNEYWQEYNVFSGGRIDSFDEENIIFSTGFSYVKNSAQNPKSLLGKILKVNLNSGNYEMISFGHRNPQGLKFVKGENLIINSEHGPKGGDEINFNYLDKTSEEKNYGWDIASYGTPYNGPDLFKKSHSKYGFVEPAIYFTPSIGISELLYFEKNSFCKKKCVWASSLRANSVYLLNFDQDNQKLSIDERIHLKRNRIRDIDFDQDLNLVILLSENIPSIVTLEKL